MIDGKMQAGGCMSPLASANKPRQGQIGDDEASLWKCASEDLERQVTFSSWPTKKTHRSDVAYRKFLKSQCKWVGGLLQTSRKLNCGLVHVAACTRAFGTKSRPCRAVFRRSVAYMQVLRRFRDQSRCMVYRRRQMENDSRQMK